VKLIILKLSINSRRTAVYANGEAVAIPITEAVAVPITEAVAIPITEAISIPITEDVY
jgi:hypothetical protein